MVSVASTRARKIVKKENRYEILKLKDAENFFGVGRSYSLRGLFNFLKDFKDSYDFYIKSELASDSEFRKITEKIDGLEIIILS